VPRLSRPFIAAATPWAQAFFSHQASYPIEATSITLGYKGRMNSTIPIGASAFPVQQPDQRSKASVRPLSHTRLPLIPGIIPRARDT
jgi:hypothetical protein